MRDACLENQLRLCRRENTGFAEYVAPVRETFIGDARQHLVDDEAHVVVAPLPVLDRNFVSAHEGRHEIDCMRRRQRSERAQHLHLASDVEAVAALHFRGCRSGREHLVEPCARCFHELALGGAARRAHGRHDSASVGRNLRIRRPGQPLHSVSLGDPWAWVRPAARPIGAAGAGVR